MATRALWRWSDVLSKYKCIAPQTKYQHRLLNTTTTTTFTTRCSSQDYLAFALRKDRSFIRPPFSRYFSSLQDKQDWEDDRKRIRKDPYEQAIAELPEGAQIHLDFFGEPVTFIGANEKRPTTTSSNKGSKGDVASAISALDGFVIGLVSKGKAFVGGGEEQGVRVQAAHSAAIAWADMIRHAVVWNTDAAANGKSAPMLVHVVVAPLFASAGVAYVRHLDELLSQVTRTGVESWCSRISLMELTNRAIARKDDPWLTSREKAHLQALDCLSRQDLRRAMMILYRQVQLCPGDTLALSLLMDISHTLGESNIALRGATAVSAYWDERKGGLLRPSIPGYNTTMAVIALGLAVGGRRNEAETIVERVRSKGEKLAGGMATWALAHILDAEGRTAEGISACSNNDGLVHFEACGFILFDAMLSGYGVRFSLDREERGRGRSGALRLYDNNYESLLDYSGFAQGQLYDIPYRRAPVGWKRSKFEDAKEARAFLADMFGSPERNRETTTADSKEDSSTGEILLQEEDAIFSLQHSKWEPTLEDVLTWIPPTPQFLADATLLLLRLTLNGTISCDNYRWENLRNSWLALLKMNEKYNFGKSGSTSLEFCPLVCVAGSLVADPSVVGKLEGSGGRLAAGLHKMGELLNLGGIDAPSPTSNEDDESDEDGNNFLSTVLFRDIVADKQPNFWLPVDDYETKEEWKTVLKLLSSAIDGIYDPTGEGEHDIMKAELSSGFEGWEFDVRPFLEHAVVYAACKCGDYDSLSIARSICSRGVTLRPNSPEEWWRYSIVLGLLGDEVASEDALAASHAMGGGQGARLDN
ncbi:hypothetical protein IV203_005629 [Nitzschia inconspicua]|uniref:Uncharacterized protein n=1 Tax=Nitzschia inconspicua TaxID=303405 RepID=A0A9K3KNF6_9STRA|nr:hypothetical protein IV203_005629 [Nitzschia inconspicua]